MKYNYSSGLRVVLTLLILCTCIVAGVQAAESYTFVMKWGTQGSGDGQFEYPNGVAMGSAGNIYVVDAQNNRIQKFTSTGTFVMKWGTQGSGDGQFGRPWGVAVDSVGNVYVADWNNNRIQKFSSTGTFITKWGTQGSGDGQFNEPSGIAVDGAGNVYVADTSNNRIQKFTSTGTFVMKWGTQGSGDGQFNNPNGVAMDGAGNVYIVDWDNNRIQKFTSTGTFLTKWGTQGSGDGQFRYPNGVAVDSVGNVYVADAQNNRIQKFTSTGTFLTKWGSYGADDGQFKAPYGVAVDTAGNVYVTDSNNQRIQKFSSTGTPGTTVTTKTATTVTTAPTTTVTTPPTTTVPTAKVTTVALYTLEPVATVTSEVSTPTYVSEKEPDLCITSVEGPVAARPGEEITVTDTIRNQGDAEIKSVYTNYYLSTNNQESRSGIMLQGEQHTISLLNAGAEDTGSVTVTVPADIQPGTYYLRVNVYAKPQDNLKEDSNPWNNYLYTASSITVEDSGPEQQASGLQQPVTGGVQQTTPPESQLTSGKYTSLDALVALKISVEQLPFDINYDVSKDGKVNSNDARLILGLAAAY